MMKRLFLSAMLFAAPVLCQAEASTVNFSFAGPGVGGTIQLTYGLATDAKYPDAFEVTGISGTFTDTNNGLNIVNATIDSLVPINHATPEMGNDAAPLDFSRFAVANGLDPQSHGFLSFDNLFWPGGSPQTATSYPLHGGLFDIYGLLFSIGNDTYVNLWSNGDPFGSGQGAIYGVAVVTPDEALDYVGGVSAVPEPSAIVLLGIGTLGMLAWRHGPRRGRSIR